MVIKRFLSLGYQTLVPKSASYLPRETLLKFGWCRPTRIENPNRQVFTTGSRRLAYIAPMSNIMKFGVGRVDSSSEGRIVNGTSNRDNEEDVNGTFGLLAFLTFHLPFI